MAALTSCTTLRSKSARAKPSHCLAPTAPARRQCSRRSWAWSNNGAARSGWLARTFRPFRPIAWRAASLRLRPRGGAFSRPDGRGQSFAGRAASAPRPGRLQALLKSVYDCSRSFTSTGRRLSSYLSGGEQQMVAIGRMLMSDPKVMLLDEPSVALSPVAVGIMVDALLELRKRGASLLLVEQRIDVAVRVCDRLYVMTHGAIVEEMTPDNVRNEGLSIINKYLGLTARRNRAPSSPLCRPLPAGRRWPRPGRDGRRGRRDLCRSHPHSRHQIRNCARPLSALVDVAFDGSCGLNPHHCGRSRTEACATWSSPAATTFGQRAREGPAVRRDATSTVAPCSLGEGGRVGLVVRLDRDPAQRARAVPERRGHGSCPASTRPYSRSALATA